MGPGQMMQFKSLKQVSLSLSGTCIIKDLAMETSASSLCHLNAMAWRK